MKPSSDVLLEVRDVSHAFGGVAAVDHANVAFERGTITGIIGPNGAGKSTLINLISGTLRCRQGEILFDGQNITRWQPDKRARAGMRRTFQLSSEFKRLTVMENLLCGVHLPRGETLGGALLGTRWWGDTQQAAVDHAVKILARFGLDPKANEIAGILSGGERRLVEIGRALMSSPGLLLLDEPCAGVHPRSIDRIVQALKSLRESGVTLVACLHEPDIVSELCDTVAVMSQGRVLAVGRFDAIRADRDVLGAYLGG